MGEGEAGDFFHVAGELEESGAAALDGCPEATGVWVEGETVVDALGGDISEEGEIFGGLGDFILGEEGEKVVFSIEGELSES